MSELKINEITFSNVDTSNPVLGAGAKHTRADLTDNGKYSVEQYDTIVNEVIKPGYGKWADFAMVNAVDIDWNGAQLKNGSTVKATLNTTGEMLSILQTAYNYATTYNVKYSSGKLYDDKGTEIKVGSDYTLPTASSTVLGGVKVGTGLSISSGVLSVKPEYVTDSELAAKSYITTTVADGKYQAKGNYLTAIPSEYVTESELAAKSYITTTAADGKYAGKNHQHTEYANAVHEHSNYAIKSHASTTTTYGVGTSANYGHLKISGSYATQTTAADIALSLGGAYNMYKAFVTRISELAAEITALKTRVTTLEGYHATKPVTAVTVTPETCTLYGKGETATLSYSITPTDASNKSATWTSDKTAYVTVGSTTGVVTTVAIGSATIKATAQDGSGKYDTCALTVKEARITKVNAGSDITVTYGSSISRITPTQTIQSGDGAVFTTGYTYTRTSGDSVTVNNGALTIVKAGTSEITVKSNADNTKSDVVKVTINKASQTPSISGNASVTVGSTLTLTGSGQGTLSWKSDNEGVATVNNGVVTGVSAGTAKITLTAAGNTNYNSGSNYKTITVNRITQTLQASPTSLSWSASEALSEKTVTISGNKTTLSVSSSTSNITATLSGTTVKIKPTTRGITNATVTISAVETGKYTASSVKVTVNVAAEAVKYYWYAGQTQPTSLTTNPTPSSEFTNNNWFEIGTTLPTVINQRVTGGISGKSWYAAVPTAAGLVAGADGVEDTSMTKISTITVNGVQYDIWDALGVTATRFTVQFYKK